jgi:hypothetical protein
MTIFKLSIEELLLNPNSKITLGLPTGVTLSAFMVSDTFEISASANYEALFDQGLLKTLADRKNLGPVVEYGEKIFQTQAKSLEETTLSYRGTEKPTFSLELLFVAINAKDDPRKSVRLLLEGCFPTVGKTAGELLAPWGYQLGENNERSSKGKMVVSIGTWFTAPNQVLTNVSFNFSKETIKSGVPLYAQGSIQFGPDQQLYAHQISSYFSG